MLQAMAIALAICLVSHSQTTFSIFVVAEKRVWSGSHMHLVLVPPTVVGVIMREI